MKQQKEQQQVWTALEPHIASETAVLLNRPPKPLLEHLSKRTTFYMLLSQRKPTKCMCVVTFLWHLRCDSRVCTNLCRAKKSAAEPRYMTFEAQTFYLNKDT